MLAVNTVSYYTDALGRRDKAILAITLRVEGSFLA